MRLPRSRGVRIGGLVLLILVLVTVLAELLVPGLVARRVRDRVGRYGTVRSVSVSVQPAIKALWGSIDSLTVRAGALSLSPAQAADLIAQASGVDRLDATAPSVRLDGLALTDASFSKRGSALHAVAYATAQAVAAALPPGVSVALLGSGAGQVTVRVTGALFGIGASVNAAASADAGAIVVSPTTPLLGGVRLTLFSDPRIHVEALAASVVSTSPLIYRLEMRATLR
jgi:hypothetical protein